MNNKLLLVIPCYNEESRLNINQYTEQLNRNIDVSILFVDDGSKDSTLDKINNLKSIFPNRITYIKKSKNEGKALAIYSGFKEILSSPLLSKFQYIGYIDADLAVSIDEIDAIKNNTISEEKLFGFGSRWKRIGSNIDRNLVRHYIGRIFATIASKILKLGVYDTQCGAKVFHKDLVNKIFNTPFNVNWVFDVEIFFRIIKIYSIRNFDKYCIEIPLKEWKDIKGSKVKYTDIIRIIRDFITLTKIYNK